MNLKKIWEGIYE